MLQLQTGRSSSFMNWGTSKIAQPFHHDIVVGLQPHYDVKRFRGRAIVEVFN
jgi:hypothetical protein